MKTLTTVAIVGTLVFLNGCSGHVYTVLNPNLGSSSDKEKKEHKIKGILVFPTINVIEVYETTALVDEKTKKITAKAPSCVPERSIKFDTRADYSAPYQVYYNPGLFETNTFGVTLKDGVLASVNTSSDPSKAATATASLLPFVAAPKVAVADIDKEFCNAQPKLIGVFKAPDVRPYTDIPN